MPDDKLFMKLALGLARRGLGRTSPNPAVGAVIVKNGRVIGKGYHERAGFDHAEVRAIKSARGKTAGSTLYVNLEPCDHFGKTPPCTEVIIKSGIKRVVAAMRDPNPLNNGKGFKRLREAGISVTSGILADEAVRLNEAFIKYITTGSPFVTVKTAQSLDGKIAAKTGDSRWITGERSRRYVHELRRNADAVLVGANTVIRDDPLLTSRTGRGEERQPIKIIVDSGLKISDAAKIFGRHSPAKVILATTKKAPRSKIDKFKKMGCDILILKEKNGKVDMRKMIKALGKKGITNVLVEGGGELIGSLADERLVDKFLFFISPKIIGGRDAKGPVGGEGVRKISHALILKNIRYKNFGDDLLIEGYLNLEPRT
jgi:diaminohydroxyphosphoribosylaminopyrimidine deaminase/5-amino-6-(5-phosphoribosylamino)uracil reductase